MGREGWKGREGGVEGGDGEGEREVGKEGFILCDSNFGVGEYGMERVHNEEPERSWVTS